MNGTGHNAVVALLQALVSAYGQLTYGFVLFLVMWVFVLQPQIDLYRVDFKAYGELLQQQTAVVGELRSAAVILDRTSTRLEKLDEANK